MAVLSDSDRQALCADFQRAYPDAETASFTKTELRAAANALDDYLNTNAATINSALPVGFRTKASTVQKARLMQFVVARRYIAGA